MGLVGNYVLRDNPLLERVRPCALKGGRAYKISMVGDPENSEVCPIPVHVWNSSTLASSGIQGQAGKTLGLGLVSAPWDAGLGCTLH